MRLDVRKSYGLFIGGAFVASESGRSDAVGAGTDESATVARGARKDLRDAVLVARERAERWAATTGTARGLVLYRLAELLDARRAEFVERLRSGLKMDEVDALRETTLAIDRTLWYAGWCDKYAGLLGSSTRYAGPLQTFTQPEPLGVVGLIAPDEPSLLGLVSLVIPPLVAGNTVVALGSETDPRTAIVFAECLATSHVPRGVANVLTGRRIEIAPQLARHLDVDALEGSGLDEPFAAELVRLAADNLKPTRFEAVSPAYWLSDEAQDLARVAAFTTLKTTWHPAAI